ncbi:hypothetical protein HNQ77_000233 [Silvibacterium bohemicum]|uniref:Uncharacterized protein n=1 Tax=Silvibacterium bohemicum TaxID=1577686 RepID=A0A841JPE7_9BACT|nr:hypothetical protein [Silvibacterium bohemicum]MBB6142295.1 hypothetical protein [Silvibacterium bohemicum]
MSKRLSRKFAAALPSLLLAIAGCGVGQYSGLGANGGSFSIASSSNSIATNGQVQFTALLPSGEPAAVSWSIAEGENASSLGEGHVDANGLYTPPSAVARDTVHIRVLATLKSDPTSQASQLITVSPGFVQSLLPQNAALTAGNSVEVTAEVAEVNAGKVSWSLSGSSGNGGSGAGAAGVLTNPSCSYSLDQYTTCKVTYTAPSVISSKESVSLSASVNGTNVASPLRILLNADGWNSNPAINQSEQSGAIALGSSGGNDNDYDTFEDRAGTPYIANCCGGTLGALVEDTAKNQYILSNNHVLAESDQGKPGDTIDEPGLIDNGCVPLSQAGSTLRPVGTLKYFVPLASHQSNVDAALAAVSSGAVDPAGSILQLGESTGSGVLASAPPVAGTGEKLDADNLGSLELVKSGRTTGLTCSSVESVDLSIRINYFQDCAETRPYSTKTFTGQIGIAGDHFSDSGDSGALVVDASNAEPVALLFSGGTDGNGAGLSVANPISDVLQELSSQAGSRLTIAGTNQPHKVACVQYETKPSDPFAKLVVPPDAAAHAKFIAETSGQSLLQREAGVLAIASGKSLDSPGEAALIVYTDQSKSFVSVPQSFDGLRTQIVPTTAAAIARDQAPDHPAPTTGIHLSANVLAGASAVVKQYAPEMLRDPAIFGAGVTESQDNPNEPALLVLVDMDRAPASMPQSLGGLRVRYLKLHPFHVTQSKYSSANHASSCALRGLKAVRTGRDASAIDSGSPGFPLN